MKVTISVNLNKFKTLLDYCIIIVFICKTATDGTYQCRLLYHKMFDCEF